MYRVVFIAASKGRSACVSGKQVGSRLSWRRNHAAKGAVKVTTRPKGCNVVIEQSFGAPKVTKDGVTVAKSIEFEDRVKNMGASLVKQVANATNDNDDDCKYESRAGPRSSGTTCLVVLRKAILSEIIKSGVTTGMDLINLRSGITMAVDSVVTNLNSRARMISTSEEVAQVGTIYANGDREIGELIAKAMEKVGKGVIAIKNSTTLYNELEVVEGMKLDRGYISHECELDNPLILIHGKEISNMNVIYKAFKLARKRQRPLLIVAEKFGDDALILGSCRNWKEIKVCAILIRKNLQDLAILTGSELITEEHSMNLEKVELEMLGTCKKVTVSKDDTFILDGAGDKKAIQERCDQLRSAIDASTSEYDKEELQERLAKLSGVVVLKIGGASEAEVGEKKDRVIFALNAVFAAVEEGIVPGDGVALLNASKDLKKLQTANFYEKLGVEIIQNACEMPVYTAASNAGVEGDVFFGKLLFRDDEDIGYDAAKGEYVDMVKAGIIDPVRVIRTALVKAAYLERSVLSIHTIIYRFEEYVNNEGQWWYGRNRWRW